MSDPGEEIEIRAHRAVDPYLRVLSTTVRDESIGWRALGILAYMLNMSAGWKFRLSHLGSRRGGHGNGRAGTSAALKELGAAGYLKIERVREAGRIARTIWHIADRPIFRETQAGGGSSPQLDFLNEVILTEENRTLSITDKTSITEKAAPHACARGDAAAPQSDTNKNKRRRQRPSGIVTWTTDDELEAQCIEREHSENEISAAIMALAGTSKQPVPGLIAAEIERQRRTRQAEEICARRLKLPDVDALDAKAKDSGAKLLTTAARRREEGSPVRTTE
ncbi:MAG: hypothetical protein ABIK08_19680 [Pseudomonadota bacterium]